MKIHKKTCTNGISMQSKFAYRILKSKWIDSSQEDFNSILKPTLTPHFKTTC